MTEDPNARRRAQSFQKKVKQYISEQIAKQVDIMEVIEATNTGRLIVRSLDPNISVSTEVPKTRNVYAGVGDRVIVENVGGHRIATHSISTSGDGDNDAAFGGDGESEFPARSDHKHLEGDATILTQGSITGDRTAIVAIGHAIDLTNSNRSTIIGGYATAGGTVWGANMVAIGHWMGGVNNESVGIGVGVNATGDRSVAVGRSARANQQYAVALGYAANADYTGGTTAIGANSDATQSGATAIGYGAQATGARSIAIGNGASSSTSDRAVIKADHLFIDSSSVTAGQTRLLLRRAGDGGGVYIDIDSTSRLTINNSVKYVHESDTFSNRFKANRKIGSAAAPLKSYPANAAGGVAMPAGATFFQTATVSGDGYTWYVAISNYGFGYIRSDLTVAL